MSLAIETVNGAQGITRAIQVLKLLAREADAGMSWSIWPAPPAWRGRPCIGCSGRWSRKAWRCRIRRRAAIGSAHWSSSWAWPPRIGSTCAILSMSALTAWPWRLAIPASCSCAAATMRYASIASRAAIRSRRRRCRWAAASPGVSAGGLALLANLTPAEQEGIIDAIAPRLRLRRPGRARRAALRAGRQVGYALIANRAVPGISAVGLPVHSDSGLLLAAVTVATTHGRMTDAGCARCCRCCARRAKSESCCGSSGPGLAVAVAQLARPCPGGPRR